MPTPRPTRAAPSASPSPSPPDPCAGEGWDRVPSLARSDGSVAGLFAVVSRPDGTLSRSLAGSERLHVRVLAAPGAGPPSVFLDIDGRETGAWTRGSAVSAAAWDIRVDTGGVQRHVGTAQDWSWEDLDADHHYEWDPTTGELLVCLPMTLIGDAHRVSLGVETEDSWLPRVFFPGIPYPPVAESGSVAVTVPERLAIAYGYRPWVVRGCTDVSPDSMACPSEVYGAFRHVVLAAGLEDQDHPSHAGTRRLVQQLREDHPGQELWGYVSLRRHRDQDHRVEDIGARAAAWQTVGVTGIFLDEADLCHAGSSGCPDEGVTRASQTAAIETIHGLGMPVFANGFSTPDLLHPFDGLPPALGHGNSSRPADMYLLENPTFSEGEWRTGIEADASLARMQAAIHAAADLGVRLAAVDTADGWVEDDSDTPPYVAGWWRAVQAGVEAYGFTNRLYSASDDLGPNLPILDPPVDVAELTRYAFASTTLRTSDGGRRISRDLVDCRGDDAGAVVTVTVAGHAVEGRLALRSDRRACP